MGLELRGERLDRVAQRVVMRGVGGGDLANHGGATATVRGLVAMVGGQVALDHGVCAIADGRIMEAGEQAGARDAERVARRGAAWRRSARSWTRSAHGSPPTVSPAPCMTSATLAPATPRSRSKRSASARMAVWLRRFCSAFAVSLIPWPDVVI